MEQSLHIAFPPNIPKYLSVADAIVGAIRDGHLKRGEQLPSINELSERHLLSRDTAEKAYKELRRQGIIESVKGKGYFISRVDVDVPLRILLVLNKISNYKKQIYNAFVHTLGFNATVDLHIHHSNLQLFENLIFNSLGAYDYYVIMPHFYEQPDKVLAILERIPSDQLILLDKDLPECTGKFATVYQDFGNDIYEALDEALEQLKHYERLIYVNPNLIPYPEEIRNGFQRFCRMNDFEHASIDGMEADTVVNKGDAFIVIEETDLAGLIRICRDKQLRIGTDVGIISYNETPLKEILLDGITVISTDHECMGRTAARLILDKKGASVKNPFVLIRRKSL
ncbi:MAG TPA: substrate-binding domain-containing protein [Chitinophagaceae bacterium]|nr:substrate-binding domain-containing protein [Chitinophagaceae bacterium]